MNLFGFTVFAIFTTQLNFKHNRLLTPIHIFTPYAKTASMLDFAKILPNYLLGLKLNICLKNFVKHSIAIDLLSP
jgi:hypothetical protein